MKKIKADILIKGNLICSNNVTGGGQIYSTHKPEKYFNTTESIVIDGDININNLNSKQYVIVVVGSIITNGGSYDK